MATAGAKPGVFRLRHGVEVELTNGGEIHVLPGEKAEPPVVKVEVGGHKEALLAALGQVRALGTKRASDDANGKLDRGDVSFDDGGVEFTAAAGYGPRSVVVAAELEEVVLGSQASEVAQPGDALDEAEGGLVREVVYAQKSSLGLDEDKAKLVTAMAALEHSRPVNVPALPDAEAIGNGLAVAVPPMSEWAQSPGGETGAFIEGLIAGGDPETPDAREEVGGGAENGRVGDSKPSSHEHMSLEGRKATWVEGLCRGQQDRRCWIASARGAVHEAHNGTAEAAKSGIVAEIDRGASKRADVGGREPDLRVPG